MKQRRIITLNEVKIKQYRELLQIYVNRNLKDLLHPRCDLMNFLTIHINRGVQHTSCNMAF